MKKALLFSGQGSQFVGMGKDLYDRYQAARDVFDAVDEALEIKLSAIIFDGTDEELTQTQNAQPALMALSQAVWAVLQKEVGLSITDFAYVAGHSLGEYSALCAAKALSLVDTAKLLRARGEAMALACAQNKGAMAAVIGLDADAVEKVAAKAGAYVANDNSVGQIVLSGTTEAIEKACALAQEAGAKRALPLKVAGAFHSPLMTSAAKTMAPLIQNAEFKTPLVPVIANVTAKPVQNVDEIKSLLVSQISGQVRWTETVRYLKAEGVEQALELGAGKVLAGLVKRTEPDVKVISIGDVIALDEFLKTL